MTNPFQPTDNSNATNGQPNPAQPYQQPYAQGSEGYQQSAQPTAPATPTASTQPVQPEIPPAPAMPQPSQVSGTQQSFNPSIPPMPAAPAPADPNAAQMPYGTQEPYNPNYGAPYAQAPMQPQQPWYKKWYTWVIAVVVVALLGVGVYFLVQGGVGKGNNAQLEAYAKDNCSLGALEGATEDASLKCEVKGDTLKVITIVPDSELEQTDESELSIVKALAPKIASTMWETISEDTKLTNFTVELVFQSESGKEIVSASANSADQSLSGLADSLGSSSDSDDEFDLSSDFDF